MYTLLIIFAMNCAHCGTVATTIPGFSTLQSCEAANTAMLDDIKEVSRRVMSRGAIVRCVKVD
jgi:hypothetical protein